MTKKELIQMTGSKEQANYVLEILLDQVTASYVQSAITAEFSSVLAEIKSMVAEGYICASDGSYKVDWSEVSRLHGWMMTKEQAASYDEAFSKCSQAETLIRRWNKVTALMPEGAWCLHEQRGLKDVPR